MKSVIACALIVVCMISMFGCQPSVQSERVYTHEELSAMPAEELLDLFLENGLVIGDGLRKNCTEEELQTLFKEDFEMWCSGVSIDSYTEYLDLAEQTKEIYDRITASEQ